jgi:hypothetical protein
MLSCLETSKENILPQQSPQTMMFIFCQTTTPSTLMLSIFVLNPVPFECSGSMLLFVTILGELAVPASSDDRVSSYCQFLSIKIKDDSWERTQDVWYTNQHSTGAVFDNEALRSLLEPNGKTVTGRSKKLHNKNIYNLCCL